MTLTSPSMIRARYEQDGFLLHPEPVLPADLIRRASEGMDALRKGEYETGIPPQPSFWNPGDDPGKLCKMQMERVFHGLRGSLLVPEQARGTV
jgi:hypothetical protein